jgi:3-oxoacyl-[acyl-carrier protein] reductase
MELQNARILITGGSLGIGKATALTLANSGAKVAITGRNKDRLQSAAEETGAFGIIADVSVADDVKRSYSDAIAALGGLDVLVNNAGFGIFSDLLEISEEDMRQVWETNVLGATLMAQAAAKGFVEQGSGTIINVASTAANKGFARGSAYASSKFALKGLSECWRAELRPHNVRVSTVFPSEVTTAFNNNGEERSEQANKLRSSEIAHAIKAIIEMDDRGFIPELNVFATNPF